MMIFVPTYFSAHWEWVITRVEALMNVGGEVICEHSICVQIG